MRGQRNYRSLAEIYVEDGISEATLLVDYRYRKGVTFAHVTKALIEFEATVKDQRLTKAQQITLAMLAFSKVVLPRRDKK